MLHFTNDLWYNKKCNWGYYAFCQRINMKNSVYCTNSIICCSKYMLKNVCKLISIICLVDHTIQPFLAEATR